MMISDKDAKAQILELVKFELGLYEDRMVSLKRYANDPNQRTTVDLNRREAEAAMSRWQQILAYAEKKL